MKAVQQTAVQNSQELSFEKFLPESWEVSPIKDFLQIHNLLKVSDFNNWQFLLKF